MLGRTSMCLHCHPYLRCYTDAVVSTAKGGLGYPEQEVHELVALLREAGAQQAHHPSPGMHCREHVLSWISTPGHALEASKGLPSRLLRHRLQGQGVSVVSGANATACWTRQMALGVPQAQRRCSGHLQDPGDGGFLVGTFETAGMGGRMAPSRAAAPSAASTCSTSFRCPHRKRRHKGSTHCPLVLFISALRTCTNRWMA